MNSFDRGTVVVLTYNRKSRVLQTLRALMQLEDGWPIIVVDNGSTDGTAKAVSREFPRAMLIRSRRNIGAAARNIAVAYAHTPYIAFCDENTWWESGALVRAADVLDQYPRVGVVNGCIVVGETGRIIDPACQTMARSPLPRGDLPGPQLLGFMSNSCVIRTRAFYEAGGFWPPFFNEGEEALLALDLAERGWSMVYMENVVLRRMDAKAKRSGRKQQRLLRNAIWVAWMRLPLPQAWAETKVQLKTAARQHHLRGVAMPALTGMLRALRHRHVVAPRVSAMRAVLYSQANTLMPEGRSGRSQGFMA